MSSPTAHSEGPDTRRDDCSVSPSWDVISRFDRAWACGNRPALDALLAGLPPSVRAARLPDLVAIEIEYRLKAGDSVCVEQYLERFPELVAVRDWVLKRAEQEFDIRQRHGRHPSVADYLARFPDGGEAFRARLEALAARSVNIETVANVPAPTGSTTSPAGFEILSELGRGAMGVVFLANQVELNRLVALKMILAETGVGETARGLFRREARAVAQLKHESIVPIFHIGEHDGQPYFVMEYLAGGSLARQLD